MFGSTLERSWTKMYTKNNQKTKKQHFLKMGNLVWIWYLQHGSHLGASRENPKSRPKKACKYSLLLVFDMVRSGPPVRVVAVVVIVVVVVL